MVVAGRRRYAYGPGTRAAGRRRPGHGGPRRRSGPVYARQRHIQHQCQALFGPHFRQDIEIGFTELDANEAWWFTAEEVYSERHMFHGPAFQCVSGLGELAGTGFVAELTVPSKTGLFASTTDPVLLTDPCVLDAISQLSGCWVLARFPDTYVLPVGVEKLEVYRDTPPPGTRVSVRVEITECDFETKVLRANFEVGDGEGYVWMRLAGFSYRIFNMLTQVIDVRRRPERYCCSAERILPGDSGGLVGMQLDARISRDIPLDWLARLYLHSEEMPDFWQLAEHRQRQREWVMGRIAAKDAARVWLARRDGSPDGLPHPSTFVVRYDSQGRPRVESTTGLEPLPLISISHCSKAAVAVAGDLPLGVDIEPPSSSPLDLWEQFTTAAERELLADFLKTEPEAFWATRLWCAKKPWARPSVPGSADGREISKPWKSALRDESRFVTGRRARISPLPPTTAMGHCWPSPCADSRHDSARGRPTLFSAGTRDRKRGRRKPRHLMKVGIFTFGSRGDVQPYLALALGLRQAGHDVFLCAPRISRTSWQPTAFRFVRCR